MLKSKVKGLGLSKPKTNAAGSMGFPSARSIVKNPAHALLGSLGRRNYTKARPGKVSIKGGQK